MLKIVQAPNSVLSQQARPVGKIDKSIHKLLKEMEQTLDHAKDPEGVGLAAPQVGKSLQMFVVRQTPKSPLLTFINPKIEELINEEPPKLKNQEGKKIKEKGVQLEGCLSLYSIWGVVKRQHGVVLSYQDEHGAQHRKTFDGFLATIIQHECDHLQGILFPKRVLEQGNPLYKSVKNEKGETEFEEIEI
jgi:peptide deformylase